MMRPIRALAYATILSALLAIVPAALAQQSGYYVLDGFGGVHAGGGAPVMSPQTPYFGFDIAKDVVYVPPLYAGGVDGILVLDGFGGIYAGGAIAALPLTPTTPYFGFDVARAIALRANSPAVTGGNGNGLSNTICTAPGGVEVFTRTAYGELVDARFSFIVPGFAHGQIRDGGTIRSASAALVSVEHPSPGAYCLVFSPAPSLLQAEATVVSIHAGR